MNPETFDFTRPARLPPEWQNRLSGWFRLAVGLASKGWGKELPTPIEAAFVRMETCWAGVGLTSLSDTMLGFHVHLAGQRVPTFLVLPRVALIRLVGILLSDSDADGKDRELTLVEERLADYFLSQMWLKYFKDTWPGDDAVSWSLNECESNPQCSRVFAADEALLATHWRLIGPWGESNGVWFWPKNELLNLIVGEANGSGTTCPPAAVAARREGLVINLPMPMEVILGTADLKLSELSNLRVGDVILLDRRVDEEMPARTGGQCLFHGRPGRVGARLALRIDSMEEK